MSSPESIARLNAACGAAVFESVCGHRWIGNVEGDYACPMCGLYDGGHHLAMMEQLPVQPSGWLVPWNEETT